MRITFVSSLLLLFSISRKRILSQYGFTLTELVRIVTLSRDCLTLSLNVGSSHEAYFPLVLPSGYGKSVGAVSFDF